MTRDPFAPADGEKARWRYCYDLVVTREPNEQIIVQEICELLQCDEKAAWAAMRDAKAHLESDGQRSVRTVPRFGWIVMRPGEHITAAEQYERKSRRGLGRGIRVLVAVAGRRDELSQFEREAVDRKTAQLSAVRELMGRRRKVRLADIERTELPPAQQA